MRLAALFDIHGNLPALEAVLEEVERVGVDEIVIGGDVIPGPMPRETLGHLGGLSCPVRFIFGNGEVAVLTERRGERSKVPEQFRDAVRWNAAQLSDEDAALIASWPKTLRVEDVLFCHATPRDENEIFTRNTPEKRLLPIFAEAGANVVVCGHTHMQFDRRLGESRVLNAGSVGMPFGKAGAYWLLLSPEPEPRFTSYDFPAAAARVRATGYPQAEEFASRNILSPPSEEAILSAFSAAELR